MRKFVWILTAMIVIVSIFLVIVVNVNNTNEEHVKSKDKENKNYSSPNGIDMVFVEGGTFQMGCNDSLSSENPVHRVTVSDFYIGKYEVTQGQYEKLMGKLIFNYYGEGNEYPVYHVSWDDAVEFCNKLSELEGLEMCYYGSENSIQCDFNANGYRLPTEAEWEYAAKGGNKSKGYKYAGSNNIDEVAIYEGNYNGSTIIVGGKRPNELGINNMSGNVSEWCWDWYGDYISSSQSDPRGPDSGVYRVSRGGSWYFNASYCRSANRDYDYPSSIYHDLGFRLARSLPR